MTIIVGVHCKDGVVVGADSATTFAAGQFKTIEQTAKKLYIVEGKIIVAATGEVGLTQRMVAQVEKAFAAQVFKADQPMEVCKHLSANTIADFKSTHLAQINLGALVAFPCKKKPHLCEFAAGNLQPELKTDNLWYVSMGSGQQIGDPFLGFVREVLWHDGVPNHQEGAFAVTWTLSQAIKLNPGGIKDPIQIAVLKHEGEQLVARELTADEIEQHQQNVNGMMDHIRAYREKLRNPNGAADVPAPPAPAAAAAPARKPG